MEIKACNNPSHVTLEIAEKERIEISDDSTITDDSFNHERLVLFVLTCLCYPCKKKHIIGMYIKKVHIEYRIEMTLDDSFKLLTPVGIQDRHFRRYYMENFITSLKPTKKKKRFLSDPNICNSRKCQN